MRVKEWMTPNPVTVGPHTTVLTARRLMSDCSVRCAPVVTESDRLIGVLVDTDIVVPQYPVAVPVSPLDWDLVVGRYRAVETVMRKPLAVVRPEDELTSAIQVMLSKRVDVLPVVHGGAVVGLLTASDGLRGLLDSIARERTAAREAEVDPDAYKPVPAVSP